MNKPHILIQYLIAAMIVAAPFILAGLICVFPKILGIFIITAAAVGAIWIIKFIIFYAAFSLFSVVLLTFSFA